MSIDIKKKLKKTRQRNYVARDFDSFRTELLRYARTYFPDRIKDFSEASFGGLLLDMAAMVGDSMSFYLDHQFNELNWATAIEAKNVQRHIRNAGVKMHGAAPAVVDVSFFIEVPSEVHGIEYRPQFESLPIILSETVVLSKEGVSFTLVDDIDFSDVDRAGNLIASVTVSSVNADGSPSSYILEIQGLCISGTVTTQAFKIPNAHKAFRKLTLSKESVTSIISIRDSSGNMYYEVESLAQDTVFKSLPNFDDDSEEVSSNLEVIPAPYRFVKLYDQRTRLSSIRFGGGNAESLDDDIIPDPSELSLPLYGKKTFGRFSIDPNSLLDSHTLGIAPLNTTVSVVFRHGGGIRHNVSAGTIRTISKLKMEFEGRPSKEVADGVRSSIDVNNRLAASGGSQAPTLDSLRSQIPAARQMQSRVVSKQDLLARLYTMPSNFGRIYRAGIRSNPNNPLASQLFIICRDKSKKLTIAPDTLKKNLMTYLNEFRLISDAMDVLDASVINISIEFDVVVSSDANKNLVIQSVILALKGLFKIDNFQIDQPLVLADVVNVIINTTGVIALTDLEVINTQGQVEDRLYSDISFNVDASTVRGMVIGPPGSIFELKYPDFDIIGNAS
jgi:hypothetical protein